jgi:CO/xanthine dehydrogenase FAD-binding subunit
MSETGHYAAPASLGEAAELLRDGNATLLAGGTDLMPQSKAGKAGIRALLLSLRRIPELHGVARDGDALRIGALVTMTGLMESALVREHCPILAEAADHFASDQVRNAATIGGNVCNASPAGDTLAPLLALDAEVELVAKPNGSLAERRVPIGEFFSGPGKTARAPHEIVAALRVPIGAPGRFMRFFKFGARPALDIAAISIGLCARRDAGALRDVRVAFGAVAPVPMRGRATEGALEGRRLTDAVIEAAATAARGEVHPIDDLRATAWYRREMVHNMLKRVLADAARS